MVMVKGIGSHKKWCRRERLTRQEAIEAMCYECNGGENVDCQGYICALYDYSQFKTREGLKRAALRQRDPLV